MANRAGGREEVEYQGGVPTGVRLSPVQKRPGNIDPTYYISTQNCFLALGCRVGTGVPEGGPEGGLWSLFCTPKGRNLSV